MVSSRSAAAIVCLVSAALVSTCLGFNAASSPSRVPSTSSRKEFGLRDPSRGGDHMAPSQTPTTQLSFALNEEDPSFADPSSARPEQRPRHTSAKRSKHRLSARRRDWAERSLAYYSTVSREDLRRSRGQLPPPSLETVSDRRRNLDMAQRHYFALRKIKSGQLDHAESIYRHTIDEIMREEGGCDHARLAVSTLLLALLLQRRGDVKGTRSVFLQFFKMAVLENDEDGKECACSAKVLQAYALFEMKRGHGRKSLEIVERAVRLDGALRPVLEWKQFREVMTAGGSAPRGETLKV